MKSSIEQDVTTAVIEAGGQATKPSPRKTARPFPTESLPLAAKSGRKRRSGQQAPATSIEDEVMSGSKQQYGAAESQWADLNENDFLNSRGRQQRRSGPTRGRPVITRHQVDEQIRQFFRQQ